MRFFELIVVGGLVSSFIGSVEALLHQIKIENRRLSSILRESSSVACVTGATGVLGTEICRQLCSDGSFRTFAAFRDAAKVSKCGRGVVWFPLNVEQSTQRRLWDQAREGGLHTADQASPWRASTVFDDRRWGFFTRKTKRVILVNGIAVAPTGRSFASFHCALAVNCLLPLLLSARLLAAAAEFASISTTLEEVVIVNISSGDGELAFLDSDVARWVQSTDSLRRLQTDLAAWLLPTTQQIHRETAVGATPAYSLSKAVLNRITQLLSGQRHASPASVRVVSVCPGNFLSPLTTEDERLQRFDPVRTVEEAASDVLSVIYNDKNRYVSGGFFRYGDAIRF